MNTRKITTLLVLLTAVAFCGDKGFNPPPAGPAASYPLHEKHDDEKATIAIDPFTAPDKAAVFKVRYRDYGFLPVRLIIANDGDKPLMLDGMKVELVTGNREKIQPATRDDIFRRLVHPEKVASRPKIQLPIPIPRDKSPISKDAREEIEMAMFTPVPVTPHSSHNGFLFFDVAGVRDPENGAHLYISGIKAGTQELFYFDIPLEIDPNQPAR